MSLCKVVEDRTPGFLDTQVELIIFPQHGAFFSELIRSTQKQVIVSSQVLPSKNFCDLLIGLHLRQVDVKILLSDPRYFRFLSTEEISQAHGVHKDIVSYSCRKIPRSEKHLYYLNRAGLYPHFINHEKYMLNHAKYLIIDEKWAFIGSSVDSRDSKIDLGLLFREQKYVRSLNQLFFNHYNHNDFSSSNIENIIVSPNNMRKEIEGLIEEAQHSIIIIATAITDDIAIYNLLEKKLSEGIEVSVLFSPHVFALESHNHKSIIDHYYNLKLINLGAHLRMTYNPAIHCKCIVIDHAYKNNKVYIGSANLRTSSLDNCLEVGVILDNGVIMDKVMSFYIALWKNSVPYQ